MYKRICKGLSDIGQLVPYQEKVKTKQGKDYYESIYYYTDEQKVIAEQEVEKDGKKRIRGVSGITEVITDKLVWDLDSEDNLEDAKNDTISLAQKLYDLGYKEEEVRICFSGKKGFSVTVYIGEFITPDQFKAITSELASGLKTYDSVVANPSRIIRLANTKHQDSGLYKTPYTFEDLKAMSTVEIKEYASGEYEEEVSKTWTKGTLVEDLRNIEVKVEEQSSHDDSKIRKGDLKVDYRFNPYNLVPWKLAIQQGIFPSGCRSNALMILAASLKAKNLHEEDCYYQLKSAVQKQARRFGADKFDKKEIYNNIIGQVYGDNWTGATYSVENFPQKLKDFYEDLGIPKTREVIVDEELIESVEEGFDEFVEYANSIDENTMQFGLKSLDDKLKIRKGHLIYMLAPPGVGKTSMAITILNNMSKQGAGCYFGSYDMYKNNVYQKLIQRHTGLPEEEIFDVFRNKDQKQIEKFRGILSKEYGNVSFCFKVGQSIADLKRSIEMEEKKRKRKIDLVVVDYLELVLTDSSDPTASSAEAAQGLREIANAGRVVVGLLQPNKMNSKVNEPITSYNGAKGSSTIAQSATAILTAHRPGMDSATNNEFDHYFSINCVKNRNGSLFNVDYGWVGKTQTIYELEEIERLALADYRKAKAEQKAAEDDF